VPWVVGIERKAWHGIERSRETLGIASNEEADDLQSRGR
jgi:hypothetical protein